MSQHKATVLNISEATLPTAAERRANAQSRVDEDECIPAAPPVAVQIHNLTRQFYYSNEAFLRLIEIEPELTAQLLRLVNSVAIGGSAIGSLDTAIIRLGANEIARIAMSLTLGRLMAIRPTSYVRRPEMLWRHCVRTALACRFLHPICRRLYADADLAFTAGLLHDIGKIVLNQAPPDALEVIGEVMLEERINATDAEVAIFGSDHAEIGGLILERWKLPSALTNAVRLHHAPEFDDSGLATLVHVGNCCAKVHAGSNGWIDFRKSLLPLLPAVLH